MWGNLKIGTAPQRHDLLQSSFRQITGSRGGGSSCSCGNFSVGNSYASKSGEEGVQSLESGKKDGGLTPVQDSIVEEHILQIVQE